MTAHVPKKHLGQNFLVDPNIKNKIIAACRLQKDDIVLEIGPGPGALTRIIAAQVKTLYAVETDARFCEDLKRDPDLEAVKVIHGDILKYDLKSLPPGTKVIGNLPYYISSPIIERLIGHRSIFPQCFLTVQWEFGRRLTAQPHTKDYGSLSCFAQYYGDVKILFKIPPAAFRPAPRVVSCFVAITSREPQIKAHNEPLLFDIRPVSAAGNQQFPEPCESGNPGGILRSVGLTRGIGRKIFLRIISGSRTLSQPSNQCPIVFL